MYGSCKLLYLQKSIREVSRYEKIREEVADQLGDVPYAERIAKLPAIILLAVDLLAKYDMFHLNRKEILDLLLDNIRRHTGENVGMAEKAFEAVMQIVSQNYNRFYIKGDKGSYVETDMSVVGDVWGTLEYDVSDNLVEITMVAHIFERELRSYGFNNITTVIHEMKEKQYLNCEPGKNYRRRTINVGRTKCMVIIPKN